MLGRAYIKLAQQQGIGARADNPPDPIPAGSAPITTGRAPPATVATEVLAQIFPDLAPLIGTLLQFLPQLGVSPDVLTSLLQPRVFATGAGTGEDAQKIAAAMRAANGALMMRHAERIVSGLEEAKQRLPDTVKGIASPVVNALQGFAKTQPALAGQLLMQLRQMGIPGLSTALNIALRDIPMSYEPLVGVAYKLGRGTLDPQQLNSLIAEYERAYNSGAFVDAERNKLDASMALGGFALAARMRPNDPDLLRNAVTLTHAAHLVMQYGLASDPAVAQTIVLKMGPVALDDPQKFQHTLATLSQRFRALGDGDSVQAMVGALEASMKTGQPLLHAAEAYLKHKEREDYWQSQGLSPEELASRKSLEQASHTVRSEGINQSDYMKALSGWVLTTTQGRRMWDNFLANPSAENAQAMFAAARSDPRAWNTRMMHAPSVLLPYVSEKHMPSLLMGEEMAAAGEKGGERWKKLVKDPQMWEVIAHPMEHDREKLMNLPPRVMEIANNPGVRSIVNDYLTEQQVAKLPRAPAPTVSGRYNDFARAAPSTPKPPRPARP